MSDTGYVRRGRRTVYENPWLRFEAHDIVHPNGVPGEHGLVVCPVASAVVAIDGDDVILTRQARFAVDQMVLEVVKGGGHGDELPLACAQRELREELGFTATEWTPLGIAFEVPSILQEPVWLFLARDLHGVTAEPETVESIHPVRMSLDEAMDAVMTGGINDGVTALALIRATARLRMDELTAAGFE